MNTPLLAGAVLSLATWAIHLVLGGRDIARPLLEANLAPVPKLTAYYCWHLVTIVLFAMSGAYAYAAWVPGGRDVAILVTGLSVAFAAWSGLLVASRHPHPLELPQWILFLGIAATAAYGLA